MAKFFLREQIEILNCSLKESKKRSILVDKKVNKDDLIENLDIYKKETEANFSSEDLKKLSDIKDFKTIVFEFNDQKKVITKTKGRYIESEFGENLPEITLFGENIDEDILNNLANQRVEEKKNKVEAGLLDEFFGNQWKNRK